MGHLKDHVVGDYESSEVAVIAVVLIATRGPIYSRFGLDEWISRGLAARNARWHVDHQSRCRPSAALGIRRVAVARAHRPPRQMSRRFVGVQRHCAVDSLRSVL